MVPYILNLATIALTLNPTLIYPVGMCASLKKPLRRCHYYLLRPVVVANGSHVEKNSPVGMYTTAAIVYGIIVFW